MDATCTPADLAHPTDLNLLNAAREKLVWIIDTLHEPVIGQAAKPQTYREKARKQFLTVSKQRRPGLKVIPKADVSSSRTCPHYLLNHFLNQRHSSNRL